MTRAPTGTTTIQIQALCAGATNWVGPCGNVWQVSVRLAQGVTQPTGSITIAHTSAAGGVFSSTLPVVGEVTWNDGFGTTLGPVTNSVVLNTNNACWSHTGGPGAITASSPLTLDANCDGVLDTTLPGTSNFFPGWCPGGVWTPVPHDGPHPVGASRVRCEPVDDEEPVDEEPVDGEEPDTGSEDGDDDDATASGSGTVTAYPCPEGTVAVYGS